MRILGAKSGFRTARDFLFFVLGMFICIYHIVTTPSADLSWQLLIFGAGIAGAPIAMKQDEKRRENGGN